jgi:D-3-phosphoglycerate dehydrogenase
MRPTVLIAESQGFSEAALATLRSAAEVTLADLDRPGLLRAASQADVLWVRLRHRVDREVFESAERLRVLVTATTGLNHVDLAEAARRRVQVLSLCGEAEFLRDVRATAEHTVGLLLALLRQTPAAVEHVKQGGWDRDRFRGREAAGKTVGLVGYGRLGRLVGQYLAAMGARTVASDPYVQAADVEMLPLADLLRTADVVSLHASLTAETQRFFGRAQFAAMKPGAWFINTARGELVDETALLEALESGKLAGAALDVLAGEDAAGMAHHPLVRHAREHPNVIVTPHIGGCTSESMEKTERYLAEKLVAVL